MRELRLHIIGLALGMTTACIVIGVLGGEWLWVRTSLLGSLGSLGMVYWRVREKF